jgi:hypothetical protein
MPEREVLSVCWTTMRFRASKARCEDFPPLFDITPRLTYNAISSIGLGAGPYVSLRAEQHQPCARSRAL